MAAGSKAAYATCSTTSKAYIPNPGNMKQIEGFHNFLSHSAETFLNVKVEEGGVAEFEMNLEPFTTLMVAVTSED